MRKSSVYYNESGFNSDSHVLSKSQTALQNLFEEVGRLNLIKIKSIDELIKLSELGEEFIHKKLETEITEPTFTGLLSGLRFSKQKIVSLLELPNLSRLNELCEVVRSLHSSLSNDYLSIKGDKVVLDQSATERLKERNTIYANNSEEEKLHESHKKLVAAMKAFTESHEKIFGRPLYSESLSKLFFFQKDDREVSIRNQFYLENPFPL